MSGGQIYSDISTVLASLNFGPYEVSTDPITFLDFPLGPENNLASYIIGLFSGGGGSDIPWWEQLRLSRRAHPLYVLTIGISEDQLGNGERSPAPAANGKAPSNTPPNQKPEYRQPRPSLPPGALGPNGCVGSWAQVGQGDVLPHGPCICYFGCRQCNGSMDLYNDDINHPSINRPKMRGTMTGSGDCFCSPPGPETGCPNQ